LRYFVPDIQLESELPVQEKLEERLGGLPWGLPNHRWPRCAECGHSQSLLAQFLHHPVRLDLGGVGRTLWIFQCNHDPGMCETWSGTSGANACFVLEPDEVVDGFPGLPEDAPSVERGVRITRWIERDDGLPDSIAPSFFELEALNGLPEDVTARIASATKLGSVPFWIQNPDEGPGDQWRFVGQLDAGYSFYSAPKSSPDFVLIDERRHEGRTHFCEGPNFGDAGIGYIFLQMQEPHPKGHFFWQCG
jgi:hypothetical protein